MISIPGSLSFAKLVMMSSAPEESALDARYASQDPFIYDNQRCPVQSRLQSLLRARSFYVERNNDILVYLFRLAVLRTMLNVAQCNHLGKVNLVTGLLASSRTLDKHAFCWVDAESSRGIYSCLLFALLALRGWSLRISLL